MPSASRGKNPRFIVPVISIKTTGIPKDFGIRYLQLNKSGSLCIPGNFPESKDHLLHQGVRELFIQLIPDLPLAVAF